MPIPGFETVIWIKIVEDSDNFSIASYKQEEKLQMKISSLEKHMT